jgi:hypothetical protein
VGKICASALRTEHSPREDEAKGAGERASRSALCYS